MEERSATKRVPFFLLEKPLYILFKSSTWRRCLLEKKNEKGLGALLKISIKYYEISFEALRSHNKVPLLSCYCDHKIYYCFLHFNHWLLNFLCLFTETWFLFHFQLSKKQRWGHSLRYGGLHFLTLHKNISTPCITWLSKNNPQNKLYLIANYYMRTKTILFSWKYICNFWLDY